jgi:hypothetical protein
MTKTRSSSSSKHHAKQQKSRHRQDREDHQDDDRKQRDEKSIEIELTICKQENMSGEETAPPSTSKLFHILVTYFRCVGLLSLNTKHIFVQHMFHVLCYCFLLAGCVSSWFLGGQQDASLLVMWLVYYLCILVVFACIRKHFSFLNSVDPSNPQEELFTESNLALFDTSGNVRCMYVITSFVLYSAFAFYYTFTDRSSYGESFSVVNSMLMRIAIGCSWFYYFNVCGAIYIYMICCCMVLRARIKLWIDNKMEQKYLQLKMSNMLQLYSLDSFFTNYDIHVDHCNRFFSKFNIYIIIGLLMISFRIPLSLVYIFVDKIAFEIPTLIFQCSNWFLFIYVLCELNEQTEYLIIELHRHRIFGFEMIEDIETYAKYRPLGANIYGMVPSFALLTKTCVVLLNGILPLLIAAVKMFFS